MRGAMLLLAALFASSCSKAADPKDREKELSYGPKQSQKRGPLFIVPGQWHSVAFEIYWSQQAGGKATFFLDDLGKRFDYFVYPNRDHGLSEGKGTAVHVQMLITRYLVEHLPPGPR